MPGTMDWIYSSFSPRGVGVKHVCACELFSKDEEEALQTGALLGCGKEFFAFADRSGGSVVCLSASDGGALHDEYSRKLDRI